MTKTEFANVCAMLEVHPAIALENEEIIAALKSGASNDEIESLLASLF